MATGVKSLTIMGKLSPRLSERFLNASSNLLKQKTGINNASKLPQRPKTAHPTCFYRMKSNDSRYVPLDTTPSLAKPKNGSSNNNGLKRVQNTSNGTTFLTYLSSHSPNYTEFKCNGVSKSRSLEMLNMAKSAGSNFKKTRDREDEMALDTDRKPSTSFGDADRKFDTGHNKFHTSRGTATSLEPGTYEYVKEVTEEKERTKSTEIDRKLYSALGNESDNTADSEYSSADENFDQSFEESLYFRKRDDSMPDNIREIGNRILLKKVANDNIGNKTDNWSTSVQRSLDINLPDYDALLNGDKKTLSMDINVVVSVKAPEVPKKPDTGFIELPERKIDEGNVTKKHSMDVAETENSNMKSGVLSQQDLTDEIGKVYDFLKNNGKMEAAPAETKPSTFNIYQNFDKIKNLYFNVLRCVKSFKELRHSVAERKNEPEKECLEDSWLSEELERCLQPAEKPQILINEYETAQYPIDFRRVDATSEPRNDASRLLGNRLQPQLLSYRMYSSNGGAKQTDCEKAKKLPCLQSSEISSGGEKPATGKSVCEKLCMPCCKPARDPPLCFYPYHKPPCKKEKAPRPAFSECKMLFEMRQSAPCECVRPRATTCKKSADSETCAKR